eukprot:Sspe_Gene.69334::Locus_40875_Transcript_1_1_Confidence_1.000_Length_3684::g.69334::m.69334
MASEAGTKARRPDPDEARLIDKRARLYYRLYNLSRLLKVSSDEHDDWEEPPQALRGKGEKLDTCPSPLPPPESPLRRQGEYRSFTSDSPSPKKAVKIQQVVVASCDLYHVTAVLCSNSAVILRFTGDAAPLLGTTTPRHHPSLIHTVLYFSHRQLSISSIAFEPRGRYLLVVTARGTLYLIPVTSMMQGGAGKRREERFFNLLTTPSITKFFHVQNCDDVSDTSGREVIVVTSLEKEGRKNGKTKSRLGHVSDSKWWHTRAGADIAIVAASNGFLVFVDVIKKIEVKCVQLSVRPRQLHLAADRDATSVLVLGTSQGPPLPVEQAYRVLLEYEDEVFRQCWRDITMGEASCARPPYKPVLLQKLSSAPFASIWTADHGGGREGVIWFYQAGQELEVYDCSLSPAGLRNPLYSYNINIGTEVSLVHVTSATLLCLHMSGGNSQKISVVSRFALSTPPSLPGRHGGGELQVLQELMLPGERVLGMAKGHRSLTAPDSLPVEAVLVWTENSVYEVQPCTPPDRLFISTLLAGTGAPFARERLTVYADSLAKAFKLHILNLYEQAAALTTEPAWALQLYKRAGGSPTQYAHRLALYDMDELHRFLQACLRHPETKGRATIAIAFVYTALSTALSPHTLSRALRSPQETTNPPLSRLALTSLDPESACGSHDMSSRTSVLSAKGSTGGGLRELPPTATTGGGLSVGGRICSAQATAAASGIGDTDVLTRGELVDDLVMFQSAHSIHSAHSADPPPADATAVGEPRDPVSALSTVVTTVDYSPLEVIESIARAGMVEHAIIAAMARGVVPQTLDLLAQQGCTTLPPAVATRLSQNGHAFTLFTHSEGTFLRTQSPEAQLTIALTAVLDHLPRDTLIDLLAFITPLVSSCTNPAQLRLISNTLDSLIGPDAPPQLTETAALAYMRHSMLEEDGDEPCLALLTSNAGPWRAEVVKEIGVMAGRVRVVALAAEKLGDYPTWAIHQLLWAAKSSRVESDLEGIIATALDIPGLQADVLRKIICVAVAFCDTLKVGMPVIERVLRARLDELQGDVLYPLLQQGAIDPLPLPLRVEIALRQPFITRSTPPPAPPRLSHSDKVVCIPTSCLSRAGRRSKLLTFTCGHPPLSSTKVVERVAAIKRHPISSSATFEKALPITCSSICAEFERLVKLNRRAVAAVACPQCVLDALKVGQIPTSAEPSS